MVGSTAGSPGRSAIPTLTAAQVLELERLLYAEYHLDPLQVQEHAGRALAVLARDLLDGDVADRPITVLAGRGSNGGGGLAAARHLLNAGAWVQVVCAHLPQEYAGAAARQLAALQAMGAPLAWAEDGWELPPADLLLDALIGCGLRGDPRGPARVLLQLAQSSAAPILSLDTPSGVDTAAGHLFNPHVEAAATLTLALPKAGFLAPDAATACGDLYVADISVPAALYQQLGLDVPATLFARDFIVPLNVEKGEIWTREQE